MISTRRSSLIAASVVGAAFLIAVLVAYTGTAGVTSSRPRETVTEGFDGKATTLQAPEDVQIPALRAPTSIGDLEPPEAPDGLGPVRPPNPTGAGSPETTVPGSGSPGGRDANPRPEPEPEPDPGPTEQ